MNRRAQTAGVILAAGLGHRLGRGPKAFVEVDGRSFLERAAELLRRAGVAPLVAVLPPPARWPVGARVPGGVRALTVDPDMGGMLQSVRVGLTAFEEISRVLLHPVDHPFVTVPVVKALLVHAGGASEETSHVAPSASGRAGHPIVIRAPGIAAIRATTEGTLRDALRSAGPRELVEVCCGSVLENVNHARDLTRAEARDRARSREAWG